MGSIEKTRRYLWLPILLALLALAGCTTSAPTPTATAEPTPTATSELTPTATPEPASTVTPEPTPLPTATLEPTVIASATPAAEATRINFDPGQSSAEIDRTIAEGATDVYVLRAQQGQIMSVEITSPNDDVLLSVVGSDGTPLKRYQNGPPSWTSQLPGTQDYLIHAVSVGPATSYTLRVWVEPLPKQNEERVEFEPGATSATRSGALPEGGVKEYVLAAAAGQTMRVQTVGYSAPVNFTVRSPGGATWSGEPQASEVYIFATQMVLPQDGDYVVTLSVPPDAGATRYDVAFTIVSGAVTAERIRFAAGQGSASVTGSLAASASDLYVLRAAKGQTMTVDLTFTIGRAILVVWGADGTVLMTDHAEASHFQGELPETQDYFIRVAGRPDGETEYGMRVTIPPAVEP